MPKYQIVNPVDLDGEIYKCGTLECSATLAAPLVASASLVLIDGASDQAPPPPPPKDPAEKPGEDVLDIAAAGGQLTGVQTAAGDVKPLTDLTVAELKKMASDAGVKGSANMNKAKLIEALTNA